MTVEQIHEIIEAFAKTAKLCRDAGAVLADVWVDNISMPVVDCLGDDFLEYVKDGMEITIKENGIVEVK